MGSAKIDLDAIKISLNPIDSLIPYARNARTHSDAQVAQIAASIREFGWTNPVLLDGEKGIIAGHGRVLAARKLGMGEVPCIEFSHLTEAQKRAYILADNKLAENAGWDSDLLKLEFGELQGLGFDLSLTGFDEAFLTDLLTERTEGLCDPDDLPEQPEPKTKPGDVWILGRHRLVCGDSTVATDVEKALNGVLPHLMVTDPPYGVDYDPGWRSRDLGGECAVGKVLNDNKADWSEVWALFPGDVAYVWFASLQAPVVGESLQKCGFTLRALVLWVKTNPVIGRGHYHWQHEPCWYAVREGKTGHWNGDRKQTTVWSIPNMHRTHGNVDDGKTEHSTQKPVECMRKPIENNSSPGQAIFEPFAGSGTTIIAAEQTGRICLALELNPAYCDLIVARWEKFTGKGAVLEQS